MEVEGIYYTHTLHTQIFTRSHFEWQKRGRVHALQRVCKSKKVRKQEHRVGSNEIARAQPSGATKIHSTYIFSGSGGGGGGGSSSNGNDDDVKYVLYYIWYMVYVLCVPPRSDLSFSLSCYHTKQ